MTETTDASTAPPDLPRPHKQEQDEASTEITEVAPGVLRLQLPIELPGLGHVNTYALEDGDGFALVDPGLPGEQPWGHLNDRLRRAGIPIERVHTVIVTHSHPDHFGASGLLTEEAGARLVASEHFRTFWDGAPPDDASGDEELEEAAEVTPEAIAQSIAGHTHDAEGRRLPKSPFERTTPWGGEIEGPPPERRAEMVNNLGEMMRWFRPPKPTLRLADSDPIVLAGREWFALYTPGHTNDHLCLFDPTEGILLAGDHVLPSITPHISGLTEGDALADYMANLDRVAALEGVRVTLPAHGHPISDLAGRVEAVKEHHEERLERLRVLSGEAGWTSVVELSHQLFAPRSWGSMAESETYAHLEHLRMRGQADSRRNGEYLEYLAN